MSDTPSPDAVIIERTFDAPIKLIWQMWTEADHFKNWYGPMGATIPSAEMDIQVGGKRLICMEMQTPNGTMQMWFTGEYREITPTKRLVYTESMSDEKGNIIPPSAMGMPEGTPDTTEITVELESVGNATKVKMTHAGVPADSPGASGWAMALDKMASYAATLSSD